MADNKTVLVVDDEGPIQRVIALKLKNRGYDVITANDGEEGLALLMSRRPDAVVTDIMMPKLDGKSLCEQADGLKREKPFLTIVITCRISPEERSWVSEMTDTILMEKPFSPSGLLERIEAYFEKDG